MVELKNYEFVIDGKSVIVIAGEVHYFRIPVERWDATLDLAMQAGCNTIATYLPWHFHEEIEGHVDWLGKSNPRLNLKLFLEKISARGLFIFLRPGPFIMAEMKNEGLPYWLMKKYPEIIPTTWDNQVVTTATVDYNHPHFLIEVKRYYHELMPIITPHLYQNGGKIIAIQLDNEIGMLSWVSNSPDLTASTLSEFKQYLQSTYHTNTITRYPYFNSPEFNQKIIAPGDDAPFIHFDLGNFMRKRFRRYADTLQAFFKSEGVRDIPYVINVHGTSDGRALLFPIGLSQLKDTFDARNYLAGSDLYLGDFTMNNFHDYYIVNGMQSSLNHYQQPLATVEFNCGDGNFGDDLGMRMDPASTDLKTRLCFAQDHKVINYYLLSGGTNELLRIPPKDGNNRIAITGERHGFAAPVGPEGQMNSTFNRLADVNHTLLGMQKLIATMHTEYDSIAMGWIPDYFMTESSYPKSTVIRDMYANLKTHREGQVWNVVMKMALLRTLSPKIIDLQHDDISPSSTPVLLLESALYMPVKVQEKLVDYVANGGKLMLFGELPVFDLEGNSASHLIDTFNIVPSPSVYDQHRLYLSATPVGRLSTHPEYRIYTAQPWVHNTAQALLQVTHTKQLIGGIISHDKGQLLLWNAPVPGHLDLFDAWMELLDYHGIYRTDHAENGIVMMRSKSADGYLLHLINIDNVDKQFRVYQNKKALFENITINLPAKRGLMLPINVRLSTMMILFSTLEIISYDDHALVLRALPGNHCISIDSSVLWKIRETPVELITKGTVRTYYFHLNSDSENITFHKG